MRILGIDPGIGIIGFGVIENDKKLSLIDAGVIRTTIGLDYQLRLMELEESLIELFKLHKIEVMAIEKLFFGTNTTTAIAVAGARGVIMLEAAKNGLAIYEYSPLQIKMAMVGYGRATKAQIGEMVKVQLNLSTNPKPDDAADALAVAITHASSRIA